MGFPSGFMSFLLIVTGTSLDSMVSDEPQLVMASKSGRVRIAVFMIITVAIETEKEAWLTALKKEDPPGDLHLAELNGWTSSTAENFNIWRTPTFFVVDRNGIILAKPEGPEELIKSIHQ